MKKSTLIFPFIFIILILSLFLIFSACDVLLENSTEDGDGTKPQKLSTPAVIIDSEGVARWEKVENAVCYSYIINDGKETATENNFVALKSGYSIKVMAEGDGKKYINSDWSESKIFTVGQSPCDHNFDNGCDPSCNKCDYTRNTAHTGGSVTCIKKAICSVCGAEYGNFASHTYGNYSYNANAHFKICTICNEQDTEEAHCWNQEAPTENSDKHCTLCNYVAAPALSHTHSGVYIPRTEPSCTQSGKIAHYSCDCGQHFSDKDCSQALELDSILIAPLGHDFNTALIFGDEGHFHTCSRCEAHDNITPHLYTDSCDEDCNIEGCEFTRSANHSPSEDDGNCTTPITCLACNAVIKEGKEHSFTDACDLFCNNEGCYHERQASHIDGDSDGKCDNCHSKMTVAINLYGINDLHGVFCDSDYSGVAQFSTYMHNLYEDKSAYEILFAQGDMWQGTVESSSNQGSLMTEWMNYMGFSAMALGNHEYDWGSSYIQANAQKANFPFLAINVIDSNTNQPYCQPSIVVERGGVKIGLIGAIGNCLSSISAQFTNDGSIRFAVANELTNLVKEESVRLREEVGCAFIVYILHDGFGSSGNYNLSDDEFVHSDGYLYYDTQLSNGYVDVVFEGHSHQNYVIQDEYGVYHLQGGGNGSAVSCANLVFDLHTKEVEISVTTLPSYTYNTSSVVKDPEIEKIYRKYFSTENDPYIQIVGINDKYRGRDELLQKIAELYYKKGVEIWGQDYDIVLGGGFMSCRDNGLSAGNITYAQIFKNLPFDNALVLCRAKGSTVKKNFINSTNANYYTYYTANPSSINDSSYYYIVTDSYSAWYSYNNLEPIAIWEETVFARDLIRDYIASGAWGGVPQPITLNAPSLTVNSLGVASWSTVSGASQYLYVINGGEGSLTSGTSVQLSEGDSIKVMAIGNGTDYLDSPYSEEKTFNLPSSTLSSVVEILTEGAKLADGQSTEIEYTVCGIITSITQFTYGNMYIQDTEGNTLFIFGVYDESGIKYGELAIKPEVGDQITLKGVIKKYGDTVELYQAVIVEHIPA